MDEASVRVIQMPQKRAFAGSFTRCRLSALFFSPKCSDVSLGLRNFGDSSFVKKFCHDRFFVAAMFFYDKGSESVAGALRYASRVVARRRWEPSFFGVELGGYAG
jgi:hypothetical protein